MPLFRYTATFARIYAARSLQAEPGDVVEWPEMPDDGQWEPHELEEQGESGDDDLPDSQAKAEEAAALGEPGSEPEHDDAGSLEELRAEPAAVPEPEAEPEAVPAQADAAPETKKTTRRAAAPAPKTEE